METLKLLDDQDLERIYTRLAHQLTERFDDLTQFAIVGMQTRGVYIAKRIQKAIQAELDIEVPVGVLDVTFYRDDFRTREKLPEVKVTEINFDLNQKHIVLVDDVLYTGRTVRSAMEALMSFGRPESIKFCCLVDRGHRELPVIADYIGQTVPTHHHEEVRVKVAELDHEDAVYVVHIDAE